MVKLSATKVELVLLVVMSMQNLSLHSMEIVENKGNKQRIQQKMQRLQNCISMYIPPQIFWNEDITKCAWATVEQNSSIQDTKKLELMLVKLHDDCEDVAIKQRLFNGYKCPAIDDQLELFFTKEGGIYCYGIDVGSGTIWNSDIIVEYSLNKNDPIRNRRCFIGEICGTQYSIRNLLNLPVLLKAFLRSTKVEDDCEDGIPMRNFMIGGVIIPDNYKYDKKHPFGYNSASSYDHLPVTFRNIIEKRYAEQQREKNNNNS